MGSRGSGHIPLRGLTAVTASEKNKEKVLKVHPFA